MCDKVSVLYIQKGLLYIQKRLPPETEGSQKEKEYEDTLLIRLLDDLQCLAVDGQCNEDQEHDALDHLLHLRFITENGQAAV